MNNREKWVAFYTILRREIRRFMRIWPQTLLPPVITMVLYFVIFGQLIGSRIGTMSGLPYIQFVAPGLIMMSVNYKLLFECCVFVFWFEVSKEY